MTDAREELFSRLAELGIETTTVPYPAHRTVEEGIALRGDMPGRFTKNLLLKDKKGSLFLLVAGEDQPIDLKPLHRQVGGRGQLSFASADTMRATLGVEPGALTPFAIMHDRAQAVRVVLDEALLGAGQLNFHPLVNTQSTGIRPADLVAFIRAYGREPLVVSFAEVEAPHPAAAAQSPGHTPPAA